MALRRDWTKQHNDELHNLYSSPNSIRVLKSRRMRWDNARGMFEGQVKKAYSVLVGKLQRRGPLGRPRRKWEKTENVHIT